MYSTVQKAVAEIFGTAALVLVGSGSVVATLTLAGASKPVVREADLLGISFAFGLILSALVYTIGKVSGCHINPAVTFALAVTRRFKWRDVPIYWAAQLIGAVLGSLAVWAVFGHQAIALGAGATSFNETTTSYFAAALSELIGTALLMFAILGIVDTRSPSQFAGLVIGGTLAAIILVFGPIAGASLNPARAFSPQLILSLGGGTTHWAQFVPVYLIPGLAGAAAAAFLYDFLANPRIVDMPIEEAVTGPDRLAADPVTKPRAPAETRTLKS